MISFGIIHQCSLGEIITPWKASKFRAFSGPYLPVFGLNTKIYRVNFHVLRGNTDQKKSVTLVWIGKALAFVAKHFEKTRVK